MADYCQNHMFTVISVFFTKQRMNVEITTPMSKKKGPYSGVKLIMKIANNNYTNNKSKHKMCWEITVICQSMSKLCHLQTVSYMMKIYC